MKLLLRLFGAQVARHLVAVASFGWGGLGLSSAAEPPAPPAAPPSGAWSVQAVVQWPAAPLGAWNGPDFIWLNRVLVAQPDGLTFDAARCTAPRWSSQASRLGPLLAQTFPAGTHTQAPARPQDLGLKTAATAEVQVWRVACAEDSAGTLAGAGWLRQDGQTWQARDTQYTPGPDTWWARLPDGRWLMHDGDRLLTLGALPPQSGAQPSFDCRRARTQVEKALCNDHDLAGWDRSLAEAWRRTLQRQSRAEAFLRAEHKAWLAERDACGTDPTPTLKACLLDSMHSRVLSMQGA